MTGGIEDESALSLQNPRVEEESALSPKNRLKFLCSYGGKILPRPFDGQLKYVGGETRVVSVPRSITFEELKEKISSMFYNAEVVMKYQIMPEDLDALVSVRSPEDLQHMIDEYDRHDALPRSPTSSPRFRIFLFPSNTSTATAPSFVEAFNGSTSGSVPIPGRRPTFTISSSSTGTSPTSTIDTSAVAAPAVWPGTNTGIRSNWTGGGGGRMQRVQSTPNLSGSLSQLGNNNGMGAASPRGHQQKAHSGPLSRMGGSQRYDMCGCGCGCMVSRHQSQRRHYYGQPSGGGEGCICRGGGHVEDSAGPRGGGPSGYPFGAPPIAPSSARRSIWE